MYLKINNSTPSATELWLSAESIEKWEFVARQLEKRLPCGYASAQGSARDETGEQPNTKQKVQAYTNPDIKKFEASIAVNQQKFDKTRQQYIEHYISIGKINSKSSAGEIEKAFSPENMKELSRLQGLINKNKALLIEAKKIEAQWNKLA